MLFTYLSNTPKHKFYSPLEYEKEPVSDTEDIGFIDRKGKYVQNAPSDDEDLATPRR